MSGGISILLATLWHLARVLEVYVREKTLSTVEDAVRGSATDWPAILRGKS